ncbi:MAG: hypothetical protein LQ352_006954 [Teloschistes flavicans]|nr:MAG: hypothetical protein LQ352_006954 [Teloschistes flavicans]
MPLQTVSFRPQTSRQAKRAYQKAGASPRLSAQEKRRIERTAELEARAERIRIHNLRARENKRKKAERLEREHEARKRMGIPEPVKEDVGPSQLRLGAFVTAKSKLKKVQEEFDFPLSPPEEFFKDEEVDDCADSVDKILKQEILDEPAIVPLGLKTLSPGSPPRISSTVPRCTPLNVDAEKDPKAPVPQTPKLARTRTPLKQNVKKKSMSLASLMPPPPRPPPRAKPRQVPFIPTIKAQCDVLKIAPSDSLETDWAAFFTSNTQVEREISDDQNKPVLPMPCPIVFQDTSTNTSTVITEDFLAGICTQDLLYSSPPPSPPEKPPHQETNPKSEPAALNRSFDEFDDCELSTQDFCDLDI